MRRLGDVTMAGFDMTREQVLAFRRRAEDLAARLRELLGDTRMNYEEAGTVLGVHPNRLRYAAATGTVLIRCPASTGRSPSAGRTNRTFPKR